MFNTQGSQASSLYPLLRHILQVAVLGSLTIVLCAKSAHRPFCLVWDIYYLNGYRKGDTRVNIGDMSAVKPVGSFQVTHILYTEKKYQQLAQKSVQ